MCMCYMWVACGFLQKPEAILKLEMRTIVSSLTWVLGTKRGSPRRAASALNLVKSHQLLGRGLLPLLTSACSWETEFSLDCLYSDPSILPPTFPKVHCLVTFSHAPHHPSALQSRLLFYIKQYFCILIWLPRENPPKLR